MNPNDSDQPRDSRELDLLPWEHETADGMIEWDHEVHERWCAKWAPECPDGNPRRVGQIVGYRERNIEELELRVVLGGADLGTCQVVVDEHEREVYVRVLVCQDPDDRTERRDLDYLHCPVRVWLERPLDDRAVIDIDTGKELPLFTPTFEAP